MGLPVVPEVWKNSARSWGLGRSLREGLPPDGAALKVTPGVMGVMDTTGLRPGGWEKGAKLFFTTGRLCAVGQQ